MPSSSKMGISAKNFSRVFVIINIQGQNEHPSSRQHCCLTGVPCSSSSGCCIMKRGTCISMHMRSRRATCGPSLRRSAPKIMENWPMIAMYSIRNRWLLEMPCNLSYGVLKRSYRQHSRASLETPLCTTRTDRGLSAPLSLSNSQVRP